MLTATSCVLELRGISHRNTKGGNTYYLINCELDSGDHFSFYAPDPSGFPEGLKKGDKIKIQFEITFYMGKERLVARAVHRVTA